MSFPDSPPITRRLGVTARLRALAACVPEGTRLLVDVGTSHGILPIAALRAGRAGRCLAIDKSATALAETRRRLRRCHVADRVELCEGDGLLPLVAAGVAAAEVDVICIAGVGPTILLAVLDGAREWLAAGAARLVLSPLGSSARLRVWLEVAGYALVDELRVTERGRDYEILVAEPGR